MSKAVNRKVDRAAQGGDLNGDCGPLLHLLFLILYLVALGPLLAQRRYVGRKTREEQREGSLVD